MEFEIVKDEVVISGIGGSFPKSKDVGELKAHLLNNENLLTYRWKEGERGVSNQIGVVPVDIFDNAIFGINNLQSFYMDPMHRLTLEGTFQALLDAGVSPTEVRGKKIGVFMGSSIGENDNLVLESVISGFGVSGHSRAMLPNRVSYWLNLHGPSVAYDSNWVGGIEVLRLANEAIRTGQCEAAIVGTANLALTCEMQKIYDDMGLLSREGCTKAFDAEAEGYTRSDGIVVLYLQKSSQARRSYASIVHIDTCFSTAPTGNILDHCEENLTEFLERFFSKSKVKPEEVDFVETYGCGIKNTDKYEVEALDKIYSKNRTNPLWIGSIKTNVGHAEASAALFSVVKVLLAMEAGEIPANLHYSKPNPEINALVDGRIQVLTENKKWKGPYAAVNAIGLNAYYGHVILKSNKQEIEPQIDDLPRLVLASTRTEDGIKNIMETLKSKPRDNPHYFQLVQDAFAKSIPNHLYRGYTIFNKEQEKQEIENYAGNKRDVWFVYTGMGSQWNGMLSDLMRIPICAESIRKSAEVLKKKDVDLMNILTSDDPKIFNNILHSFVGIAAMQIALTDLLHAIGIQPDGIIGHSVGELGCAYADGCLTAEEMILSSYSRGKASIETELINGMMAAVGLGYQKIKDRLPPTIEVACHNGPDSSTLSGPKEDMEKFVKQLQDEGVFARLVNVANIAYHSRYIKPAAPLLLKYLKEVIKESKPRSKKWISTSNQMDDWNTDLARTSSPEYHTNNLLSSVLFEEGLECIPRDAILIEIAPHGLLQAILKRSVKQGCTNIPLTQRGTKSAVNFLLEKLGQMYLAGMEFSVSNLYPHYEYPVGRGTSTLGDLVHWNHNDTWRTGLEGKQFHNLPGYKEIEVTLNSDEFRDNVGHQFNDKIIVPLGYYLNAVHGIFSNIHPNQKQIVFENIFVKNLLVVPKVGAISLLIKIQKGSGCFECSTNDELLISGRIHFLPIKEQWTLEPVIFDDDMIELTKNDVYNELHHRGHQFSAPYKSIKNIRIGSTGSVSTCSWNMKWNLFFESMLQHGLLHAGEKHQEGYTPQIIQKIVISLDSLPQEKEELQVSFDFATNTIASTAIQVFGLKMMKLQKDVKPNTLEYYEFTPLHNLSFKNVENGINLALQLTLNNFSDPDCKKVFIIEVEHNQTSMMNNIRRLLEEQTNLNPTIITIKNINETVIQDSHPTLIISDATLDDDIVSAIISSHCFVLVRTDKQILSYPQIVEVAQFQIEAISYSVVRKSQNHPAILVHVKTENLSLKDLSRTSVNWVNELYSAFSKSNNVYLVSNVIPTEGFENFMHEIRSAPPLKNVKLLFNISSGGPNSSNLSERSFETILKQNLNLTVIRNNILGSYIPAPLKFNEDLANNALPLNSAIKGKEVNYIGINLRDETINVKSLKKNTLGNIDYSGLDEKKNRVMGLSFLHEDSSQIIADPVLTWNVPNWMNLDEAATIPHAYTAAYYALIVKADLRVGEEILIHSACNAIGIASIQIARSKDCKIFVTVSTKAQREYLKNTFGLNEDYIFSSHNDQFAGAIKLATSGKGVSVVMNCLPGFLLQQSLECLSKFGRFIQYGKYDLEEGNISIGMHRFIYSTSFFVANFERIFQLSKEVKEQLRQLIDDGLKNQVVQPIPFKITQNQNTTDILSILKNSTNIGKLLIKTDHKMTLNQLNVENPTQFICDAKSSYLICGGTVDQWIDVAEWLILRGARTVIVSSDSKVQQSQHQRRLKLLERYFNSHITLTPFKISFREGVSDLLFKCCSMGPIHGVFVLPSKSGISRVSESKAIHFLDMALRTIAPKAVFVNFNSLTAGMSYIRSEAGFTTFNIEWLKDVEFSDAFKCLDDIFLYKVNNILVKSVRSNDLKQESTDALFKKLKLCLPASEYILMNTAMEAPNEPKLVQLQTLCPQELRELIPLFIIPGLTGGEHLNVLMKNLMYPAFKAILPSSYSNITELGTKYVKLIQEVCPSGPYNLAGISWGGVLAMEIARQLNTQGAKTHMYFFDGAPNTLKSAVKLLGDDEIDSDINLLTRIINIRDIEVIRQLKNCSSFEERAQIAINYSKVKDIYKRKFLTNGLIDLRRRLCDLLCFKPNGILINGTIHLIRPEGSNEYDNCGLIEYCKTTPQIQIINGDHLGIVSNFNSIKYINEMFNLN